MAGLYCRSAPKGCCHVTKLRNTSRDVFMYLRKMHAHRLAKGHACAHTHTHTQKKRQTPTCPAQGKRRTQTESHDKQIEGTGRIFRSKGEGNRGGFFIPLFLLVKLSLLLGFLWFLGFVYVTLFASRAFSSFLYLLMVVFFCLLSLWLFFAIGRMLLAWP